MIHNYRELLNQALGKYSPIIDIEHFQLFSPLSIQYALDLAEFSRTNVNKLINSYPLYYWLKHLPIPLRLKKILLGVFKDMVW